MSALNLNWSRIKPAIPHLYFALLALIYCAYNQSFFGLLLSLPFLKQVIYPCKVATLFLAILTMVLSVGMCVAVALTVIYKLDFFPFEWHFFASAAFLVTSLFMSVLLFREARLNDTAEEREFSAS